MIGGAGTEYGLKGLSVPVPPVEPGVERWGINELYYMAGGKKRFAHCTRWFDLHHKAHIIGRKRNTWGRYQTLDIPVYLWETFPDLPTSRVYPRAEVQRMFGGTRLFNSSLDWLIALALYEGFTEIELYAYRMGHPNYKHQVGTAQWWLQQCYKRGVKVTHLSPSVLAGVSKIVDALPPKPEAHHLMYGFETSDRSKLYRGR